MRRTITLDQLETQVPEGVLAAAEKYFQEGRVEHLREIDKNLWQARITGFEQIIEPEVLLRGNYVKAFSCECSKGSKKVPCAHLIALLLLIRKVRRQKIQKQASAAIPEFKTRDLIEILPESSLRKFLHDWSERDPEMVLALRAEFFHHFAARDHAGQLDVLFQPFLLEDGGLATEPASSLRSLQVLIRHVLRQTEALLISDEDPRAYINMGFILRHLSMTPGFRNRSSLAKHILQIVAKHGLRESLDPSSPRFDFLLKILPFVLAIDEEKLLPLVLLELQAYAGFSHAAVRINSTTGTLLRERRHAIGDPQALLLVYYQTLRAQDKQNNWIENLGLPRLSPSVYTNLASTLLGSGDFEGGMTLSAKGLEHYPHFADLLRIHIKCLWELHDFTHIPELLHRLLTIHLIPEDLDLAKAYLPVSTWESFCSKLGRALQALPSSYGRNVLLAETYFHSGNFGKLEDVIVESESPKLMQRFIGRLHALGPDSIVNLLERFLQRYLAQHLGPPATKTVSNLLGMLTADEDQSVRSRVIHFLKERFPERLETEITWERPQTILP